MEKIHPLTVEREQSSPVKTGGFAFLAWVMVMEVMVGVDGGLTVRESVSTVESIGRIVTLPLSDTSSMNCWLGSWFLIDVGGAVMRSILALGLPILISDGLFV